MNYWTITDCEALDRADPLGHLRTEFRLPPGRVYLDGNSLGPLTHTAHQHVTRVLEQEWAGGLIQSWNTCDWIGLPERLGARIAPLIGAQPEEVTVADSTSINLFKLALAACRMTPRRKVVTELGNFTTDLYVLQGLAAVLGRRIELHSVPREQVFEAIDSDTALVVLTHVHYKSAELFDIEEVTMRAHACGAAVLWDLSHSVGAMPLALNQVRADFAVGCTYKFLNGGPGSPAFLYVRRDLQDRVQPAIAGWLGHATPFDFSDSYQPASGIRRHRSGTPGILGMAALEGALGVFEGVDLRAVREKSVGLTTLFMDLMEGHCQSGELTLVTPRAADRRGSHVSYRHPRGYEVMQELIERGVIGDFRSPDMLRFGFAPLYTRYVDVWSAASTLQEILTSGNWQHLQPRARHFVT